MKKRLLSLVMALAIVLSSLTSTPAREVAAATSTAKAALAAKEARQISKEVKMSQAVAEELAERYEAGELSDLVEKANAGEEVSSGSSQQRLWSLGKSNSIEDAILKEGEGNLTQTLTNGKSVSVSLSNSVMTLTVDGSNWNYYDTPSVATAVISDDDVLHVFWHSGHYYAFDLYEKDAYVMLGYHGVDGYNVDYYVVTQADDPNVVLGTSAGMANKTCILDKQYFKMYGQVLKKRLITRAQLEELIYGKKPTPAPTAVPTAKPTEAPTAVPTAVPTEEPVVVPTMEPMPTMVPPTLPPMPTLPPLSVPTKAPSPTLKPLPTQHPNTPTTKPDVTIDTTIDWSQKTDFEVYLEWQKNFAAIMSWEAYAKVVWGETWKEHASNVTVSETWYEYDENGNRVHEVTVSTSNTDTTGQGGGSAGVQAGGTATVVGSENGAAHLTGSTYNEGKASVHTEVRGSTAGSSSKNVISYSVRYPKGKTGYVSLVRTVNKKAGVICKVKVNYKKHTAKFDGKVYKNVKQVYYSLTSRQILIRYRNNRWDVVARAKGKAGTKYTTKRIKGTWNKVSITPSELVNRIMRVKKGSKIIVKGVSNVQPKKLK